ncbi:bactofilin family protein [Enterobacter hormaechei]|uniref:bactofilin family protein n=1 Tax=Enterobacter hormaechei TaxID=158836 RepID=UPI0032DB96D3
MFKSKKSPPEAVSVSPETSPVAVRNDAPVPASAPGAGILRDVVLTAVRKDVFIAQGSHFTGTLNAGGNIVTEGDVEGNITSTHQVRVDAGGVVKGDIRAAHIVVNGLVTGRCYAAAVSLLGEGRIEGDVFTDELAIERGGIFIGQSGLPPEGEVVPGRREKNTLPAGPEQSDAPVSTSVSPGSAAESVGTRDDAV